MDSPELSFHPEAAKRFDERARDIRTTVQGLRPVPNPAAQTPDVHPVDNIRPEDIISRSKFVFEFNPLGDPTGVVWVSGTMHVGWVGPAFEPIKALVESVAATKPFPEFVSFEFLLKQICEWLCDTLERRRSDTLSTFIAQRSNEAIREHDIWIPLFQTYSWKRAKAENATALLRFLSPANLNSRLTSLCTPTASGLVPQVTTVFMDNGRIGRISRSVPDRRATDWLLDDSIRLRPGILENLNRLASDISTEFCRALYDALILYSRQTLAVDVSDKLVFTLSALESMLLRDGNEPIQKNLGERMAFLIGQSPQARKDIVKNIEAVYRIRSAFVHHGQTARHVETVDRFLINAWTTFSRLMDLSVKYKAKAALIGALEDLKMS